MPLTGKGFDVQFQKNGGAWSGIVTGVGATQITTVMLSAGSTPYARIRNLNAAMPGENDWSPSAIFTVR